VSGHAEYPYWTTITTRWMDNDMYGHVNNVHYYSFFDTVITHWLVREGGMDPGRGDVIGLCVESQCTYHAPLSFPETVSAGLRVGQVGRSSVRYEIALHGEGRPAPAATGHFVHVFVDRLQRTSVAIPHSLRRGLEGLQVPVAVR
jgi:acyl-CoA thioester hydrolase